MITEKIVLKVGKKKIEFTKQEYDELKDHFADKIYIPYPMAWPYYPDPPYNPSPTWYTISTTSENTATMDPKHDTAGAYML